MEDWTKKDIVCDVCQEKGNYREVGGAYLCNNCGTVSQDAVIEEGEYSENLMSRKKHNISAIKKKRITMITQPVAPVKFLEAYQLILKQQIQYLIEERNINAQLETVVGYFWFLFLDKHFDSIHTVQGDPEPDQMDVDDQNEENDVTEHQILQKKQEKKYPFKLNIYKTLSFLYLACLQLREPVLEYQLLKWAISGKLPYMNVFKTVKTTKFNRKILKPMVQISPFYIHKTTRKLCNYLKVDPPSLNVPIVFRKYFIDLNFAEQLVPVLTALFYQYRVKLSIQSEQSMSVILMAYSVYIMKLVYKFDDNFDRIIRTVRGVELPHTCLREFITEQNENFRKSLRDHDRASHEVGKAVLKAMTVPDKAKNLAAVLGDVGSDITNGKESEEKSGYVIYPDNERVFHSSYNFFLQICSGYLGVSREELHQAVQQVEKGIIYVHNEKK